ALVIACDHDHGIARRKLEPAALGLLFVSQHFGLEDLRGERDDLHEVALSQLSRDRSEDARAAWVVGLRQQHCRVFVEPDERAVGALVFLVDADDDGLLHITLLDLLSRLGILYRGSY